MPWYCLQRPYFVSNICESYTQNNLKTIVLRVKKSDIKTNFEKLTDLSFSILIFSIPALFLQYVTLTLMTHTWRQLKALIC